MTLFKQRVASLVTHDVKGKRSKTKIISSPLGRYIPELSKHDAKLHFRIKALPSKANIARSNAAICEKTLEDRQEAIKKKEEKQKNLRQKLKSGRADMEA